MQVLHNHLITIQTEGGKGWGDLASSQEKGHWSIYAPLPPPSLKCICWGIPGYIRLNGDSMSGQRICHWSSVEPAVLNPASYVATQHTNRLDVGSMPGQRICRWSNCNPAVQNINHIHVYSKTTHFFHLFPILINLPKYKVWLFLALKLYVFV